MFHEFIQLGDLGPLVVDKFVSKYFGVFYKLLIRFLSVISGVSFK